MAGNPLALLDLAAEVGADRLADLALAPEPLPLSHRLEEHYLRELHALPIETQTMLLVVATESTGDAAIVAHAGALLGVEMTAATDAETAGLLRLGATIQFRHPLIRSAVYGAARPADRREVHRALAAATDASGDADRTAWHLAAATVGRDEHVAGLLESRAERAS